MATPVTSKSGPGVHLESEADDTEIAELHRKVLGSSPVGHTLSTPISLDVSLTENQPKLDGQESHAWHGSIRVERAC